MLRQLADHLWVYERGHRVFGLEIGARMAIIRLRGNRLWLQSPVRFDAATAEAIKQLGTVDALLAPNKMHYRFLAEAKARFPDARVYAAPGLKKKRPELPIDVEVGGPGSELPEEFDWHVVGGMPGLNEVVLLHRASRTLIASDLIFHFLSSESWLTRTYLKLNGGYGRAVQTKLLRSMVKDRAAFAASRDLILTWEFDRVIVSHGELLERNAKGALADALAWA